MIYESMGRMYECYFIPDQLGVTLNEPEEDTRSIQSSPAKGSLNTGILMKLGAVDHLVESKQPSATSHDLRASGH